MAGPTIVAKFLADTSALVSGVDDATSKSESKMSGFAKKAGGLLAGAFAVDKVLEFGKGAIDAASSVNESISKIGTVFGDAGDDVVKWAENSATAMGISNQAALEAVGTYGNLAVSLGLPQDKAADMSKSLVGLAGDMASFNNVPVDEALQALQSGLTGETEPLKKFGIALNESAIQAEAMALGIGDGKTPLDSAAKAQATYSLIMKKSATAQGDFARTSDGLANQNKINAAKFADMQAALGEKLLPVMTAISGFILNSLIPAFQAIGKWIGDNIDVIAAIGIAIGVVGGIILATMIPTLITWIALQWALLVPLLATAAPFIAIGIAVAALAFLVIKNWDTIKAVIEVVFEWLKGAADVVWQAVQTAFHAIADVAVSVFNTVKGSVETAFNWVRDNWPLILAIVTGPIGLAVLLITRNWDAIKAGAGAVVDFMGAVFSKVVEIITWPYRMAWQGIQAVWELIKTGATATFDFISGVFSGLANAITAPVRLAWNALASVWNSSVGQIEISIPAFVPGIGGNSFDVPDLPFLARGAVLTSPTLFVGGEAGTEIVAPEAMLRAIVAEETGGGSYTLNIYPRTADAADVAYGFRRLELMAGVV